MEEEEFASFRHHLHVNFMLTMLHGLPSYVQTQDSNRLTLAYFAVSGLDILNAIDRIDADQIIDWVYAAQVLPTQKDDDSSRASENGIFFGFSGSATIDTVSTLNSINPRPKYGGHLASTYSALAILRILGDDFSRVRREAISTTMRTLQQPDGSFSPVHTGGENDLRFIFCAVAICAMLDDWSGIELQQAMTYILNCQSYDGGFGLSPGLESHGGASYCAIAALKLMGHVLPDPVLGISISSILDVTAIIRWCVQRQSDCGGFQGRLNKPADACYAFWIGGLLQMLGAGHLYDSEALYSFQLSCQTKFGGFSKCPGDFPDLLHAYYGICSLSLLREPGLNPVWCELGITARTQGLST
eukprot:c21940_g1_i3 orf=279-1352(-)